MNIRTIAFYLILGVMFALMTVSLGAALRLMKPIKTNYDEAERITMENGIETHHFTVVGKRQK